MCSRDSFPVEKSMTMSTKKKYDTTMCRTSVEVRIKTVWQIEKPYLPLQVVACQAAPSSKSLFPSELLDPVKISKKKHKLTT